MADVTTVFNNPQSYTVPQTPLSSTAITPPKTVNHSDAPIIPSDNSGFNQNLASLSTLLKQIQDTAAKYQTEQQNNKTKDNSQTTPPAQDQSVLEKLLQGQQDTTNQLQTAQSDIANKVNAAEAQTPVQQAIQANEASIAAAGYTPEAYKNMVDLSAKMTAVQSQISDLDAKYAQDVQNAQNQPGQTQDESAAAVAGITRSYQTQRATLTSQGNLLGLQVSAASNNYQAAASAAADYVKNATYQQAQTVSDLKWGAEQYNSIISNMSSQNQALVQFLIGENDKTLIRTQDELNTKLNWSVSTGLNLSSDQLQNMTPEQVASAAAEKHNQQVEIDQAQQEAQIQSTQALTQERQQQDQALKAQEKERAQIIARAVPPKEVKGQGGVLGFGTHSVWEYTDPATGQKATANTLQEAQDQQNALTTAALNSLGSVGTNTGTQYQPGQVVQDSSGNQYTVGADGITLTPVTK